MASFSCKKHLSFVTYHSCIRLQHACTHMRFEKVAHISDCLKKIGPQKPTWQSNCSITLFVDSVDKLRELGVVPVHTAVFDQVRLGLPDSERDEIHRSSTEVGSLLLYYSYRLRTTIKRFWEVGLCACTVGHGHCREEQTREERRGEKHVEVVTENKKKPHMLSWRSFLTCVLS